MPTRIFLIALKTIAPNEELTYFYGREWLQRMQDDNPNFACLCGEKRCLLPRSGEKVNRLDSNSFNLYFQINKHISFKNTRLQPCYDSSEEDDDLEQFSNNESEDEEVQIIDLD